MIVKTTALVAIVLLGFLVIAEAQTTEPVSQGGVLRTSSTQSDDSRPNVVAGWNYFHIASCSPFGTTLYLFPLESFGVGYFFTSSPVFYNAIAPACQTGNWVAIFVTNPATLDWNQFWTYTFK